MLVLVGILLTRCGQQECEKTIKKKVIILNPNFIGKCFKDPEYNGFKGIKITGLTNDMYKYIKIYKTCHYTNKKNCMVVTLPEYYGKTLHPRHVDNGWIYGDHPEVKCPK